MKQLIILFLLIIGTIIPIKSFSQATLEVKIIGIRSDKGEILMSLYDDSDQYPRNPRQELGNIRVSKKTIKDKTLTHKIEGLKPGDYALSLLDDENKSGDIDLTRLGIPTEGFGFSNNVRPFLSAPAYRRCVFKIKEGTNKIEIKVQYKLSAR